MKSNDFGASFLKERQLAYRKQLNMIMQVESQQDLYQTANSSFNKTRSITDLIAYHRASTLSLQPESELYNFETICQIESYLLSQCFQTYHKYQRAITYWDQIKYSNYRYIRHQIDHIPNIIQYWRVGLRQGIRLWIDDNKSHLRKARRIVSSLQDMNAYTVSRIVKEDESFFQQEEVSMSYVQEVADKKINNMLSISKILVQDCTTLLNHKSEQLISSGTMEIYSSFQSPSMSISSILQNIAYFEALSENLIHEYKEPSLLTRSWFPTLLYSLSAYVTCKYIFKYSSNMYAWIVESYATIKDFITLWLVEPVYGIYQTVRHKETRLALLGTESLKSDIESLERMVIEFAKDQGIIDQFELSEIAKRLQNGDLSTILKTYESEIKNPVRNLLTGGLIRSLFIQIQKAKVDGELAVSALDKLLKSNELNFAFLTVIPSFMVAGYIFTWIKGVSKESGIKNISESFDGIRRSLRDIERLLNSPNTQGAMVSGLSFIDHGKLIFEIQHLRTHSKNVPSKFKRIFLQDIHDLERSDMTVEGKIKVISRIWRMYGFLSQL